MGQVSGGGWVNFTPVVTDIADEKREFERKVRTVLRGLTIFFKHLEFLNIFKYGLFSYQFFCHKLLRWLVFPLLERCPEDSHVFPGCQCRHRCCLVAVCHR